MAPAPKAARSGAAAEATGSAVTGHYEVRELTRMGVRLVEIVWCPPGEPPIKVCEMVPERVPLLAEALAGYLADAG